MFEKQFYARIAPDGRKQTVMEHLRGTAERASSCLAGIGLAKSAYLGGLLHDLGKFTSAFQTYLKEADVSKRGSVIHTFQGCRYLLELVSNAMDQDCHVQYAAELLAFAVGAHHGLFDCVDEDGKSGMQYRKEKEEKTFFSEAVARFLEQGIAREEIDDYFAQACAEIGDVFSRIDGGYPNNEEFCFEIGMLARLLLSAVIEGDRRDTKAFMNQTVEPVRDVDLRQIWKDRLLFLEKKLEEFPMDNPVAKARTAISNLCKDFAENPKGVYRLNVPTGGGKTLSSLRYALAHAEKYNQKHLIFTSPLLSILDQNAKVIHEYVGDDNLILEHHSAVVETEQKREQLDERELLTQSWDAPIIITTLVQFLNCLFDGKTASIRRFQALCNSVIVIDEVQTVPTKMLSLFNLAIRFLAEQCGATVILCSATQPYWEAADHPLPATKSVVPYDPDIWKVFARTRFETLENHRLEELPGLVRDLMEEANSLLVVCNKKDEAAFLFSHTKSKDYISYHLSASMCMQHRRDVVTALQASLARKEKVLCISTQVIEAGVDISFQRAIRLTAGMDSVVQTAGRCNRNGESKLPCPVYIVNCTDEKLGKLQDIQRGKIATISLLNAPPAYRSNLVSDTAIEYYYRQFYQDMNEGAQDYPLKSDGTTILDLLSENQKFIINGGTELEGWVLHQAFKTAGRSFTVFDENTVDVLVPYGAGERLLTELCSARCAADMAYRESLLKRSAGYTVSLYEYQRKQLEAERALFHVCDGCVLALRSEYYGDQIGLIMDGTNYSFREA